MPDKDSLGLAVERGRAVIKEAIGRVTGDRALQAKGAAERVAIQIRSTAGGIKPGTRVARKR